jgi:DUF917 family protein
MEVVAVPRVTLSSLQDLKDFVTGCTLYGVGGGGNPAEGLKALEEQFNQGKTLGWVDAGDLPAGTYAACTFLMGSTAPLSDEKKRQMKELGFVEWKYPRNLPVATAKLEEFTGKTIAGLIPLELGGSNTPVPVAAAASLGKLVVDGDFAGRAVPEITQTMAQVKRVSFTPATSFDKYGNYCVMLDAMNLIVAERIGKFLSDVAFGSTGMCGFMIEAQKVPETIVPGTLTMALQTGRLLNSARREGRDPVETLRRDANMYVLFRGTVVHKPWEDRDGYYWGTHEMQGEGEFAGEVAKVVFKNENHLFYLGSELLVSSPDLIMNLDPETGMPLRNEDIEIGQRLVILGAPCHPLLRVPEFIQYLGPRHFGAGRDYVPIEQALGK